MDRAFLDANILVSAALKPDSGLCRLWSLGDVRLLGSPHVVAEARRNVRSPDARIRLEGLIARIAVLPAEPADFEIADDPGLPAKDRPVLLAAIVSKSTVLLTGDLAHFGCCMGRSISGVTVMLPGDYLRTR